MGMKLTVQTFLTLDGVMQAPGGPEEDPSESFTHGGWQAPFPDPAVGAFVTELTSHASAFLLGRRTFGIFRGYGPDQTDPANPSPRRSTRCPSTSCPARSARPMPRGAANTPTPPAS
jgi:dihydrofolate reductase